MASFSGATGDDRIVPEWASAGVTIASIDGRVGRGGKGLGGSAGDALFAGAVGADGQDEDDGPDRRADRTLLDDGEHGPLAASALGATRLVGGGSYDRLAGTSLGDVLLGRGSDDQLEGRSGDDVLHGGAGNDMLMGSVGDNHLRGGADEDWLMADTDWGGPPEGGAVGDDLLVGGVGRDLLSYHFVPAGVSVDLRVKGEQDTSGAGRDTIVAVEDLDGSRFADAITGNQAANRLGGWSGADRLDGRAGADVLDGGYGSDVLRGGLGADLFVFQPDHASGEDGGDDVVLDFEAGVDRLNFARFGSDYLTAEAILPRAAADGADTLISLPGAGGLGGVTLRLVGVRPDELHAGDFEFGLVS